MQEPRRLDSTNLYPSLLPLADLLDRPPCVFCDERFRVQGCALQRRQILFTADISQRDAHVPQRSRAGSSGGNSSVVKISARKNHVPSFPSINIVLLPCQPIPAVAA